MRRLVLGALILCGGCEGPARPYKLPIIHGMPQVGGAPTISIGVVEGDPNYEFMDVVGVTRRKSGSIVVADRGITSIRFYDEKGRFIRRVSRNGEGPGELRMLGDFMPLADGFLVTDWRLRRILLFNEQGKYIKSLRDPVSPVIEADGYLKGYPYFSWWLEASVPPYIVLRRTYHGATYAVRYQPERVYRDTITYFLARIPAGEAAPLELTDTLAYALSQPRAAKIRRTPSGTPLQVAYNIHFTASSEAAVGIDRIYVADSDSFIIRAYDLSGRALHTIHEDRPLSPVTATDLEAGKQRLAGNSVDENGKRFASAETQRWVNWYYSNMPLPKTKPTRSRLLVDGNQNLWVQDYTMAPYGGRSLLINNPVGDDGRWWTVFDRDGAKLGRIELPVGFRVTEIGRDYLLGVLRDDLDVQTIVMYPLSFS
jgi:hypothetical protein